MWKTIKLWDEEEEEEEDDDDEEKLKKSKKKKLFKLRKSPKIDTIGIATGVYGTM